MISAIDCESDARAYVQAPSVLLVAWLGYPNVPNGFSLIGYDLNEVAAGRSTVVGLPQEREVRSLARNSAVFGPSLIDVFSDMITGYRGSRENREDRGAIEDRNHASGELAGILALRVSLPKGDRATSAPRSFVRRDGELALAARRCRAWRARDQSITPKRSRPRQVDAGR